MNTERKTLFAEVILPLAVTGTFSYRIPYDLNDHVKIGMRVVVSFGKRRLYTAVVFSIGFTPPKNYAVKYIESVVDDAPIVNSLQLKMWQWMTDYYLCTLGDVMQAALPANFRLSSETILLAEHQSGNEEDGDELLSRQEQALFQTIKSENGVMLNELISSGNLPPELKKLMDLGLVYSSEEVKKRYTPKKAIFVEVADAFRSEKGLEEIINALEKTPKQLEVILAWIDSSRFFSETPIEVKQSDLLKRINRGASALSPLIKKGYLTKHAGSVSRLKTFGSHRKALPKLNEDQTLALAAIKQQWQHQHTVLLQGVTSSGKTWVYAHLIKETLAANKNAVFILPEIGLTTHFIQRLKAYFGSDMLVYHSRFEKNERVEIWNELLRSVAPKLIIGVRSVHFLPFKNLGLIIVDEEHDTSLKQHQPAPRYHARDVAVMLGLKHGAKVLLGSATPSLESRWLASEKKYGYARLNHRYGKIKLPEIVVHDLKKSAENLQGTFSTFFIQLTRHTLEKGKQVLIFQNRRGYAPIWLCPKCGWIPGCIDCDVKLTYHRYDHRLVCHYCAKSYDPPTKCPSCGNRNLKMPGYGTERVEAEIERLFPNASVVRFDYDTTRKKASYEKLLEQVHSQQADIIVGTQMITKGLNFDHVQLVGILNADLMLGFPDFRAHERAFQLMVQVAGRAGRKNKQGMVVIQTLNPEQPLFKHVISHDYDGFYSDEIGERLEYNYPPFVRLIRLILSDKDRHLLQQASNHLGTLLKATLADRVLGPEFPFVSRIRNRYQMHLLIKIERTLKPSAVRKTMRYAIDQMHDEKAFRYIRVVADVDPV